MAGGYRNQPEGVDALLATIDELRQRVDGLQKQLTGLGIRIDPASNALIVDTGRGIRVVDTDGHVVAIIGALNPVYNRTDGSAQPGFELYREDGSIAAFLGDFNATTPPFKQSFQILDRTGHIVIADDTNSGLGLANPNLVFSTMVDSNLTTWPATSATTFTTIAYCWHYTQNPQVQWAIDYTGDTGVGGQFRMMVSPDGGAGTAQQIGPTMTQPTNGSFGQWDYYGGYPFTLAPSDVGSYMYFELQARVTAGTGKLHAVCSQFGGGQS